MYGCANFTARDVRLCKLYRWAHPIDTLLIKDFIVLVRMCKYGITGMGGEEKILML